MKRWAVIVAAGKGVRAGFERNKVYMPLNGRSALRMCVDAFQSSGLFDGATVVISEGDSDLYARENIPEFAKVTVFGGENRQQSVYNGLKSVPTDVEIVAVHDAARPFVTREIIEATIRSAEEHGSGIISTPVTDTIKLLGEDGRVSTPDRASLFAVQTPQSFRLPLLLSAHARAAAEHHLATDDAALVERYHGTVRLVTAPGAEKNRKLTLRSDFMTHSPAFRVGCGLDAHRLVEGRRLVLCGVEIPHTLGLLGHSDADVALHALMDAMLGAAALGDIGRHFPDTDAAYRGISSMLLLEKTVQILEDRGFRVSNADVTIVAQQPKLAPYMEKMREAVANALKIDIGCLNVKATTTEHMGYEGRGEGISAHAVVTLTREEIG